jgi:glycosyltransferase involved in cell wall biosynthesis
VRICMLNDNFYRGSGITVAVRRIVNSPAFRDSDVYLAGAEKIAGKKSMQEDTTIVAANHYRCFPLMESGPGLLPTLYKFAKWVRPMRFDVIHVHHRRLAVLANMMTPLTQVPVIFTGHLTFPEAAWFKELAPRTVTGVSPSVVEYLRRCTKAVDIRLIHNPVDFTKEEVDPSRFHLQRAISVGRLDPIKGYDSLIEAWSILRQNGIDAKLDIYGEGSLRTSLLKLIEERGLKQNVSLCGFEPDVSQRFSNYAFNILVSEKEGFPNAVVEAAAHGIPTLLTDVDGSRDALPAHLVLPNGLAYGNVESLAKVLMEWFASPQLLQADGQRFHDYLKVRCSPDVVGQSYLDVYSSLLR